MCSESFACETVLGDIEPDPGPIELSPYAERLLTIGEGPVPKLADWVNDSGDSRIIVRPHRIRGVIGGLAFERYAALSSDDQRELEYHVTAAMNHAGGPGDDATAMLNYMPVLFAGEHVLVPQREWYDGREITLASDKIRCPQAHRALLGGLATMLYHLDYPPLRPVE